jgi:broad specificity phosphatase PhoE
MRIYFVRHGESYANVRREISNRGLKHGLTRKGREQAAALADKLQGRATTRIYSSPMLRAIETSIIVANRLNLDYAVVDALREFDCGVAEGRADQAAWQMWKDVTDDWVVHKRWEQRIEGGESFYNIRDRFVPFVEELIRQYGNADEGIVCVAHGGIYWMMLPLVVKNIDIALLAKYGFDNTTRVLCKSRPEGLICVEWNETKI